MGLISGGWQAQLNGYGGGFLASDLRSGLKSKSNLLLTSFLTSESFLFAFRRVNFSFCYVPKKVTKETLHPAIKALRVTLAVGAFNKIAAAALALTATQNRLVSRSFSNSPSPFILFCPALPQLDKGGNVSQTPTYRCRHSQCKWEIHYEFKGLILGIPAFAGMTTVISGDNGNALDCFSRPF